MQAALQGSFFDRWKKAGVWERVHYTLREQTRVAEGREASPSTAIVDSPSVKTTEKGGPWLRRRQEGQGEKAAHRSRHDGTAAGRGGAFGFDSGPRGRQAGALQAVGALPAPRADLGRWGLHGRVGLVGRGVGAWLLQIIKRTEKKGFHVLPRRWVVERTFAWLGQYRRLSKDYEALTPTSEAMIHLAMIQLMVRRTPVRNSQTHS